MRLSTRIALSMVALILLSAATVASLTYHDVEHAVLNAEFERIEFKVKTLASDLEGYVVNVRSDLLAARGVPAIQRCVGADDGYGDLPHGQQGTDAGRDALATFFESTLRAKPAYLQFRLLSATGQELVRVGRAGAGRDPVRTPEDQLQDMSRRPYFQRAVDGIPRGSSSAQADAHVVVSGVDLNQDFGKISQPVVPVLRLSTPVFTPDGTLIGLLVINVDMRPALDEVRKSTQQGAQVFLVGEDGEFLVHPEREREFGKQLGNPWLLTDEFPYVRDQQGRIDQSARIITDNDGMQFAMMVHPATLAGGPRLYAIKTVPYADIAAPAIEVRNTSMMAGMIVAVAAILIAVITTRTMSKPLEQVTAAIASYAGNGRPALPVDTPGEVGVLAKAFERMMDNVRRNQLAMESEITERRRLEEQFRLAVESSPSGILLVEPDGTIKMANAESERMFGYARGELPGRSVDVLVPESIRARHAGLRQGYATAPTARRMGMGIDLNGIRKDGSSLAVEIGLTPLQTSDGLLVLSTIVDVTARKLAQERLSAYAKRLRSSNEDLEQFAYVTSHDLRAPLRGIASVAEWLAEDLGEELDERSKDNIRLMLMRTDRLSRLIDGILQYSRAGRGRQEIDPVDVEPLVRDVIFTLAAPDWVRIRLQGDFPIVQYDTTQLRQVFQNLISNAIVHMNRPEGEIVVSCTADADAWRFSVRDNGVGIPEQHLERIFELFQTLRPKDEGNTTGVGLSIVKRIVERNGGVVRVASSVGQGADFVFTVPFVPVATLSVISEVSI